MRVLWFHTQDLEVSPVVVNRTNSVLISMLITMNFATKFKLLSLAEMDQ